ncbi:MAG TPA: hypothetical protein GX497_06315 [Bacillus bacterium]|nr:hypothetical protein [Bacillus sp. (in: firmicutes)]
MPILFITILLLGQLLYPLSSKADLGSASLNADVKPTKSEYLIDMNTGVARADINANIVPKGILDSNSRKQLVDIIFMIDVSGSMNRGLITGLLGKLLGIDKQVEAAKKAAQQSIENFKKKNDRW